jgi:hypothetical protein
MMYLYECDCGKLLEKDYSVGKAPESIKCGCNKEAYRKYIFSTHISQPVSDIRKNRGKG